jgi:hypothetical protein
MARADPARAGLTVRCAIYTRKSYKFIRAIKAIAPIMVVITAPDVPA